MHVFSYEARLRMRKLLRVILLALALLLLLYILRAIYLQRFLVYDENGVHLDYGGVNLSPLPDAAAHPDEDYILKQEAAVGTVEGVEEQTGTPLLKGYSVSVSQLLSDERRGAIPTAVEGAGCVMLDLKTSTGKYLYRTTLARTETASTDLDSIEALIRDLTVSKDMTVVARVPAFQDSAFALSDFSQALPIKNGALWIDHNGSYRLDPAGKDVADYLVSIARELSSLGFDEVVFQNFDFPQSVNIHYPREIPGAQAALTCAETVARRLATYGVKVSFQSEDPAIEALSHRAFLPAETGMEAVEMARARSEFLSGDDGKLVFLTGSRDTRFQPYGKLAPLE